MTTNKAMTVTMVLMVLLGACQRVNEASNHAADATKRSLQDTNDSWRNLFTFKPRPQPQLPQTRYCYRTQTDVVCYDSPQPNMTSAMVGYQDGANISAFQPGGGSLGVSGGEPTAMYNTTTVQQAPPPVVNAAAPAADPYAPALLPSAQGSASGAPFYQGSSPYIGGAVSQKDLPPPPAAAQPVKP